MLEAGNYLLGEQDFSSFRSSQCQSKSPMRRIIDFKIERRGPYILMEIEANAFLHHMVRNIVGTLILIGRETLSPEAMEQIILAKDRSLAGPTAPAQGLSLDEVMY